MEGNFILNILGVLICLIGKKATLKMMLQKTIVSADFKSKKLPIVWKLGGIGVGNFERSWIQLPSSLIYEINWS